MATAAEINIKYKQDLKIENEKKKRLDMIEKRKVSLETKRQEARSTEKSAIDVRFAKKMKAYRKMQLKQLDKKTREIKWEKPLKKNEKKQMSMKKLKQSVFANFQWCIRFDAKDNYWYVSPIDKPMDRRMWNDRIDAWHVYPKHNYPHLVFYKDNVHCQTKMWNKMQLDWVGAYTEELKKRLWSVRYKKLLTLSENKREKNLAIEEQANRSFRLKKWKFWLAEKRIRQAI